MFLNVINLHVGKQTKVNYRSTNHDIWNSGRNPKSPLNYLKMSKQYEHELICGQIKHLTGRPLNEV